MKIKLYLSLIVGMLLFSSALFSQQKSIYRNVGFTNPQNLINGTSATTYTSTSGNFEIVVKIDRDNYIPSMTLKVNSGASFICRVYTSSDDVNYNLAGAAVVGTNNYTVNAYAKYIKITADVTAGYIILEELLVTTQYRAVGFAYDAAGNRTSRTMIIQEWRSAYNDEALPFAEGFDWDKLGLKLYPNPTQGELRFEFENYPEDAKVQYVLYDLNGKMLLNEEMLNTSTFLDLESFPDGNYILKLIIGKEAKTYQIIKN